MLRLKTTKNTLVALLAFLGLGAIFGGGVLIISPTGALIGMPLSMLAGSPFHTFLIPGIVLFLVLGVFPFVLIYSLRREVESSFAEYLNVFKDMQWAWSFSVYQAFALIVWIQLEMVFLHAVHWLHTFYMFYAVGMIAVALMPQIRSAYLKKV
jgi:hypothetical protein